MPIDPNGQTRGLIPFKPGQSGNPAGRPKGFKSFKERCQEFMEREGIDQLLKMAQRGDAFALRTLAEYGFGKPQGHVDVTTGGEPMIKAYVGVDLDAV